MIMSELTLGELSAKTIVAANSLSLRPGQEQFVTPTSYSLAEPELNPNTQWQRVVLDHDAVVGFVLGNFDADADRVELRSALWRINVAAQAQGTGVGKFAVLALSEEARRRGFNQLTTIWERGEDGPEAFFLRMGFVVTGETQYGENLGSLEL